MLNETAQKWNIENSTTGNTVLYRLRGKSLTLTYNAKRSREVFKAFVHEREGSVILYGQFGISIFLFLPAYLAMVIIAGTTGGWEKGILLAGILPVVYLLVQAGISMIPTESKQRLITYLEKTIVGAETEMGNG